MRCLFAIPPKRARSTSIGRRSSSAQRSRLRRLNESAEQRETRLGQQRVRQSQNLADETELQSQIRLEAVAAARGPPGPKRNPVGVT